MVQNLALTAYHTTYHTRCTDLIKDTKIELCLENPNNSHCKTKPTNVMCHVETLIRLKCDKYSVIKLLYLLVVWYGMWYDMRFCSIPYHTIIPYHEMQ